MATLSLLGNDNVGHTNNYRSSLKQLSNAGTRYGKQTETKFFFGQRGVLAFERKDAPPSCLKFMSATKTCSFFVEITHFLYRFLETKHITLSVRH
jgi:hypothetical protein